MIIYLNGSKVASKFHSAGASNFQVKPEDSYIGIATDNATTTTRKQFMGELHELCITKGYKDSFSDIHTLVPAYENLLLYLRFEEVDE